jgi:hypothetical protein
MAKPERGLARGAVAGYSNGMRANTLRRRAVLSALASGFEVAHSSCAASLPSLPFRPTPVPICITIVIGDTYTHVQGDPRAPQQYASLQLVPDAAVQRWIAAAETTLQGKIVLSMRAADMIHSTFWQEATLNTASGSGSDTEQPLNLASHAMLRRLQAGSILADLGPLLAREQGLRARLSADALACLQWAGAQAGLPVALWPQSVATGGTAAGRPPTAGILKLRWRPVWGVPTPWPPVPSAAPSDIVTPAYWRRRISALDGGPAQDFSRVLTELIGSLSLVLGLGMLPPAQAASDMAQALLALTPLLQVRPT